MRIKIVVQIKMGGTLSQGNMTKSRKKKKGGRKILRMVKRDIENKL